MNFNWPSLPWQVSHSPGVAAVIRHSAFETGWTARQVLGTHPKNNTVRRLLHSFQDQFFGRWQRTPNKVNTLVHHFKVSNMSSFPLQPAPKVRKIRFKCSATVAPGCGRGLSSCFPGCCCSLLVSQLEILDTDDIGQQWRRVL
jgi:hypothetical protein